MLTLEWVAGTLCIDREGTDYAEGHPLGGAEPAPTAEVGAGLADIERFEWQSGEIRLVAPLGSLDYGEFVEKRLEVFFDIFKFGVSPTNQSTRSGAENRRREDFPSR